jgi:hypothetical protein
MKYILIKGCLITYFVLQDKREQSTAKGGCGGTFGGTEHWSIPEAT